MEYIPLFVIGAFIAVTTIIITLVNQNIQQ